MNKLTLVSVALVFTLFVSCGKQQTDAGKNAEIERQVQQRLDAQHQADQQQQLAAREADLAAREKALADQQNVTPAETPAPQIPSITEERSGSAMEVSTDENASYNTFYTKLEPYGAWRETPDYGYVWQPRAAEDFRNWRPYTKGRWVYTDAGWTWVSEEPFGWATYHYGRWTRLRNIGWVWVPGDEWASAWVSWRKSDDYVGWAPLPPEANFDRRAGIHNWVDNYYDIGPEEYAFVPTNEFGSRRLEQNIVPPERNVTIVTRTTNVTNITYNNTTIVNQGPNYDELRGRSRQPIERLRLEREARFSGDNTQPVVRGEVIAMPAPFIAPAQRRGRPARVKETLRETVVDRGSTETANQPAREKARAKMRAEATPPSGLPPKKFVKPAPVSQPTASASLVPTATPPKPTATVSSSPVSSGTPQRGLAERKQQMEAQQAQDRQQKAAAQRKLIEDQKAEKEKLRAAQKLVDEQKQKQRQAEEQRKRLEQKAAEQQKMEDLRKAKKPSQPPAPMPISSVSPNPTVAPARVPTPPSVTSPRTSPPTPIVTPSATSRPNGPTASPSVANKLGKNGKSKDKKKDKRPETDTATSPTVGVSPSALPR